MFERFYQNITGINLVGAITVYIGLLALYAIVPESIEAARHYLSLAALFVLGLIALITIDRLRS